MLFKKDLIKIIIKSWFVCGYVCTVNIMSAKQAQGYKIGTKSFLPLSEGDCKNKQTRGKTHTYNLPACVPFGTGMRRDQLKSAILVSQGPEDFFARVKLSSLRVHVVLVNFIGE